VLEDPALGQPATEQLQAEARAYLEGVAERLRARSLRIQTRVLVNMQPAVAILEQSLESPDGIIAVATHGRGGLTRALLGSVADKVVRGATMPVLAEKKIIQPKEFPTGGPFSPAVLVDGTLYLSGQIGRDLKTQKVPEDFEAEVRQVLDNIGVILREAKMNYADVVSVQVYLTDMELFPRMNAIYTTYFKTDRPARTAVGVVKLAAPGARIEITVTARR